MEEAGDYYDEYSDSYYESDDYPVEDDDKSYEFLEYEKDSRSVPYSRPVIVPT